MTSTGTLEAAQDLRYGRRKLELYLRYGAALVDGWLDPYSARLIARLSEIQTAHGVTGEVGEIGIHHGRLMLLLLLLSRPGEAAFVCDLFEQQHLNVDRSGQGNERVFDENVARFCGPAEFLIKYRQSSFDLRADDILRDAGKIRLFSVDGGHTAECAFNDVSIAGTVLSDGGIAIIDDYFNADWPGVSEGVGRYLAMPDARLRPLAISPNKLFLTTRGTIPPYAEALGGIGYVPLKTSSMFGHPVTIYRETTRRSPLARALWPHVWSAYSWLYRLDSALPRTS
jgi:hypothetical protein